MPIQFTCPHCGRHTNVSEQYAGQSGPCAGCGKTITVPVPGAGLAYAAPAKRSPGWVVVIVILVAALGALVICGGFMAALMLPAVQAAREAARRSKCSNQLRQIGLAMHNYHDSFGCFPPAYIPDDKGRPMHSWRVLILPFMEEGALYDQYDFDEPWDGPNNRALAARSRGPFYHCPSDTGGNPSDTSYVMLVGKGTISDGAKATRLAKIEDGTSSTILIVEVAASGINWMEPRDLDVDKIGLGINDGTPGGISSRHLGGAQVLFCNGGTDFLDNTIDPDVMEAMSTIRGGEPVDRLDF